MSIDPEVGYVFQGTFHAVDFYINGNCQWAIEFVVNSDRIQHHMNRFDSEKGVYSAIPYQQYLIVNFVDVTNKKKKLLTHDCLMTVQYTQSFDKWMIHYKDYSVEIPIIMDSFIS